MSYGFCLCMWASGMGWAWLIAGMAFGRADCKSCREVEGTNHLRWDICEHDLWCYWIYSYGHIFDEGTSAYSWRCLKEVACPGLAPRVDHRGWSQGYSSQSQGQFLSPHHFLTMDVSERFYHLVFNLLRMKSRRCPHYPIRLRWWVDRIHGPNCLSVVLQIAVVMNKQDNFELEPKIFPSVTLNLLGLSVFGQSSDVVRKDVGSMSPSLYVVQ